MREENYTITIETELRLTAIHSLPGNDIPHAHDWHIQWVLSGKPVLGKVIDLPWLRAELAATLAPLQGSNLNQHPLLLAQQDFLPTLEHLALYFRSHFLNSTLLKAQVFNPSLQLHAIHIDLSDILGIRYGTIRMKESQNTQ